MDPDRMSGDFTPFPFTVDRIPGHSGVTAELSPDGEQVRFQAVENGRFGPLRVSRWSGWFFRPEPGDKIALVWDAFDWSTDD